ncbi:hypothetical protein J6W34_03345 [bacterium]|nr:hypothetical protein [bacterium]
MAYESFEYYLKTKMKRLMLRPFKYWRAYSVGIIDENGEKLREPTSEEKQWYNVFDELIRRIKYFLYKYTPNKGFVRYELMRQFIKGFIDKVDESKLIKGAVILEDKDIEEMIIKLKEGNFKC